MTERTFPDLLSCEELLTDSSELYFRQVTEAHCDGDMVYATAFQVPGKKRNETPEERSERYKLSGARSLKQTAQGAYEERQLVRPSAGTWAVSVQEVRDAGTRLVDDGACPVAEGEKLPTGHTYLDQRVEDSDFLEQVRMTLAGAASRRRRVYPPSDS